MGVYLAADRPQPLVAWSEARPSFNVTELSPDEAAVRGRFSKPYVYYLGAYTGCSCGFTPDAEGEERMRSDLSTISSRMRARPLARGRSSCSPAGTATTPSRPRAASSSRRTSSRTPEVWFDELVFATIRAADD